MKQFTIFSIVGYDVHKSEAIENQDKSETDNRYMDGHKNNDSQRNKN